MEKQTDLDKLWAGLGRDRQINIIANNLEDFGLTDKDIAPLLFDLPLTEAEVIKAIGENRVGAWFVGGTEARADISRGNTVTIVDFFLGSDFTVESEEHSLEDYIPFDKFDDVDIITRYTVMLERCKELGYDESVAKKRLLDDYNTKLRRKVRDPQNVLRLSVEAVVLGLPPNQVVLFKHVRNVTYDHMRLIATGLLSFIGDQLEHRYGVDIGA